MFSRTLPAGVCTAPPSSCPTNFLRYLPSCLCLVMMHSTPCLGTIAPWLQFPWHRITVVSAHVPYSLCCLLLAPVPWSCLLLSRCPVMSALVTTCWSCFVCPCPDAIVTLPCPLSCLLWHCFGSLGPLCPVPFCHHVIVTVCHCKSVTTSAVPKPNRRDCNLSIGDALACALVKNCSMSTASSWKITLH